MALLPWDLPRRGTKVRGGSGKEGTERTEFPGGRGALSLQPMGQGGGAGQKVSEHHGWILDASVWAIQQVLSVSAQRGKDQGKLAGMPSG